MLPSPLMRKLEELTLKRKRRKVATVLGTFLFDKVNAERLPEVILMLSVQESLSFGCDMPEGMVKTKGKRLNQVAFDDLLCSQILNSLNLSQSPPRQGSRWRPLC